MLSPKMQRSVRVNDTQLLHLADRAQYDHSMVSLLFSHKYASRTHLHFFPHHLKKKQFNSMNMFVMNVIRNMLNHVLLFFLIS